MGILRCIATVLGLYILSEVSCTEDNYIRTPVGVIELNPPVASDTEGADPATAGDGHSRVRRSTGFTAAQSQAILDRHNDLRSQVSPEAADMIFMEWDDDLATMAQQWSDMCNFDHGQPTNISPFDPIGQNLYLVGGGANNPADGVAATQAWYNEDQFYTYETRTCSDACGHYTQVVWADSYALGCGLSYCSTTDQGNTNVWIITCNYGPAGNYNRHPYISGPSCTECSSGSDQCYNNQCRSCSDHNEECICNQECENCGTLNSATCTCTCPQGYIGSGCSVLCDDFNDLCDNGWYVNQCNTFDYVFNGCPKLCGTCVDPDPDFVCIQTPESTECPCIRHVPPGI